MIVIRVQSQSEIKVYNDFKFKVTVKSTEDFVNDTLNDNSTDNSLFW